MKTTSQRVAKHRAGLRASGLRPVQIWLPDTRHPDFVAACRRQSLSLLSDTQELETQEWLAKIADTTGWE